MAAIRKSGEIRYETWRTQDPAAVIPSLAKHLNREVNKGVELNVQNHMAALIPGGPELSNPVIGRICTDFGISEEDYLGSELYLIPAGKAGVIGEGKQQLLVSGRLDNLAMTHALLQSMPDQGEAGDSGIMALFFDAEVLPDQHGYGSCRSQQLQ